MKSIYSDFFKRVIDLLIAILSLIVLSPLLLVIVIILSIVNKGFPFFYQERPGKDSVLFRVIKFKTLKDLKNEAGKYLPDQQRETKAGKFLRKYSLDELPQLVNVLKGEMSIVGPRPLLTEYLRLYNREQARRMEVRPGLTGLAQVNGRNKLSWDERFRYDIFYVDNISFLMDLKIIFKTAKIVMQSKNINASAKETMAPFRGASELPAQHLPGNQNN